VKNQLTSVATDTSGTPTGSRRRSEFTYDGRGRLRKRVDYYWNTYPPGSWQVTGETRYVYDGMRVIQERSSSNVPTVAFTRGSDLSGSLEGAGGIGGLLARSHGYSGGTFSTHSFYQADGNGNVTYLVNSAQAMVANYRYDPYGNTRYSGGTLASANTYRFSSKEVMPNSGLYYHGYRFYDPNLQRWLNRDQIGEPGSEELRGTIELPAFEAFAVDGPNLYSYVGNKAVNKSDPFGLASGGQRVCNYFCVCDPLIGVCGCTWTNASSCCDNPCFPFLILVIEGEGRSLFFRASVPCPEDMNSIKPRDIPMT
jgi:RHS repeat-associated protein